MPIIKKFIIFSPEYSLLYTSKTFKISFKYIKDYPEKKSSHSDTMGVIFPYFWFFDVFFTYREKSTLAAT
jgi:hypothetical protein